MIGPHHAVQNRVENPCREFLGSYLEANRVAKLSRERRRGGLRHEWGSPPGLFYSLPSDPRCPTRPALRARNGRATLLNQAWYAAAWRPQAARPRARLFD